MLNSTSIRMVTVAAVATWLAPPVAAQTPDDCGTLEDLKIEDTNLLSSTVVPAADDLPEYCRVLGYVRPAINFEIRLPTKTWNGKFYMAGCGAQCGKLEPDRPGFINAMNHGLRRNYAAVTMDGGHWGGDPLGSPLDPGQGPDRPLRLRRSARSRRRRKVTQGGDREPTTAESPEKSYFAGCSNGGRQANMEAWKYPEDFDGIISGCPIALPWQIQCGVGLEREGEHRRRTARTSWPSRSCRCSPKAVYDACAGEDGLIEDPGQCRFKPDSLECPGADARTA